MPYWPAWCGAANLVNSILAWRRTAELAATTAISQVFQFWIPHQFWYPIDLVRAITASDEIVCSALTLFCKKWRMSRFNATSQSSECPARASVDAEQWVDIHFPKVEELLQRLARAEDEKLHSRHLFGSWTMTAAAIIIFICVPGCATATILLMKYGNFDALPVSAQSEQILAKADRLPRIEPIATDNHSSEQISRPAPEIVHDTDVPEPAALRGTIENVVFTMPVPDWLDQSHPAPAKQSRRRNANRMTPVKLEVEPPSPASQPPSMLEKLFSVIASVTQLSGNPTNVKHEE